MEYNGKELVEAKGPSEMRPTMVVWDREGGPVRIEHIIAYASGSGFPWRTGICGYVHAAPIPEEAPSVSPPTDTLAHALKRRLLHARKRIEKGLDMTANLTKYGGWEVGYWHGCADALENVLDEIYGNCEWDTEEQNASDIGR